MDIDYDYLFKVLLIGDSGVGKSSILSRFVDEIYTDVYISTVGVDFKIKTIDLHNQICKIQVWDTAGQERFKSITSVYYKGANGCIIVYDITDKKTFENVYTWISELERYGPEKIPILLVGNKSDMEKKREVSELEGFSLAKELNIEFMETSAKNNLNIDMGFTFLTELIKKRQMSKTRIQKEHDNINGIKILPLSDTDIKKQNCCIK